MDTHICKTERDYGWRKVAAKIMTEKRNNKKKKGVKETEKKIRRRMKVAESQGQKYSQDKRLENKRKENE
jgi:hypothetical protein